MVLFEEEVRELERKISAHPTGGTVFYGSSSIRLWATLEADFPEAQPINIGFGGATLAACAWHFERLVVPVQPHALILYAGDNDLAEGRQPEEVCLFFYALAEKIIHHFPNVPVTFLSIKPSPARWILVDQIRTANALIAEKINELPNFQFVDATPVMLTGDGQPERELYVEDGLHLSPSGYARWREQLILHANAFKSPAAVLV
ncbi:GDSL-type esterase/lipase family protein [Fibrivirga algicola]|uniref:GDSL family lipase n=1 Tax=Fibrivirga algicola TaxID=2950420 RepID=A0ABX0QCB4_9BACT|nr:GDSL-type esterase/lipase family protein [Fibrivirga algicola]ARK09325.1 GDSL family lipase [Fibrella sp. ES10-3-2-2]NID08552.1 GDSL family lipase [Fibrivirga algicola]